MHAPSTIEQYNQELLQAHREAIATLRELLAAEKDPNERRRLSIAILKARPVKDPAAQPERKAAVLTTAEPSSAAPATKRAPSRASGRAADRNAAALAELRAIAAILDPNSPDFQRLLSAHTPQPAAEQSSDHPGDIPELHHPPANPKPRAVA